MNVGALFTKTNYKWRSGDNYAPRILSGISAIPWSLSIGAQWEQWAMGWDLYFLTWVSRWVLLIWQKDDQIGRICALDKDIMIKIVDCDQGGKKSIMNCSMTRLKPSLRTMRRLRLRGNNRSRKPCIWM
jgi:hypothetical protein